jgi:hypothetical protein
VIDRQRSVQPTSTLGRMYPEPQHPTVAPVRPRSGSHRTLRIVLGSVGGLVVLVAVAGGLALAAAGHQAAAKPSVRVTSCQYDGVATHLKYVVVNHDSVSHDYQVRGTVGYEPAIPDLLHGVGAGETAAGDMLSAGQGTCRITGVDQR